jgi:hypothetical protein
MKFPESAADQGSRKMGVRQNLKRCRCKHEREEDQPADPEDEREKHEVAKKAHRERIIAFVGDT